MGNKKILDEIKIFAKKNKNKVFIKKSLGQKMYFSILKFCKAVIGNSSSGIIEAPSFKIPTINIGERQSGRIKASSIIDSKNNKKDFTRALNKSNSPLFLRKIKKIENPYLKKNSAHNLITILEKIDLSKGTKKKFYEK